MKNVDKNVYKEGKLGKKHLLIFAIVLMVISLAALAGGIVMIVVGATSGIPLKIILMSIFGAILAILGVVFFIFSITMLFTSLGMINTKQGSVKDGNRAVGTVNVVKCDKCGTELPDNATFCSQCGTPVDGAKQCECGAANVLDAQYCIKCGKKLD